MVIFHSYVSLPEGIQDPEQIGQSWWFQVSPLHHSPQLVHRGDTREVSLARSSGNEGDDAGPMGQWWMDLGLGKWVEVNYGFAQTWLGNPKVWMWKKKSGNLSSTPCLMTAKGFGIVSRSGIPQVMTKLINVRGEHDDQVINHGREWGSKYWDNPLSRQQRMGRKT